MNNYTLKHYGKKTYMSKIKDFVQRTTNNSSYTVSEWFTLEHQKQLKALMIDEGL